MILDAAEWRDITHWMYMRAVRQCIDIGYVDGAYLYARMAARYALDESMIIETEVNNGKM
jgi:hypothetical protein